MGGSIADAYLYNGRNCWRVSEWSAGRRVRLKTADAVFLVTAEPAAWTNLSLAQGS